MPAHPSAAPGFDLAPYDYVLLDMNGTFLFGFDRFGREEDFGATYARLGYTALEPAEAHERVRRAYDFLAVRYVDETYYDRFPSVAEAFAKTGRTPLGSEVSRELVATFAAHELGVLLEGHRAALHRLAARTRVGLLSNLWAPKEPWLAAFAEWGIDGVFAATTFSSDGPLIKPDARLFALALAEVGVAPGRAVYVGDSWRCDVAGALGAGLDAVWLPRGRAAAGAASREGPVAVYADLPAFVDALA